MSKGSGHRLGSKKTWDERHDQIDFSKKRGTTDEESTDNSYTPPDIMELLRSQGQDD